MTASCVAQHLESDLEDAASSTPAGAIDGSPHIYMANDNTGVRVARVGFYATSSVLLVCVPKEALERKTAISDELPAYVSADYLRDVLGVAGSLKNALHAPAVAIVFPFDM